MSSANNNRLRLILRLLIFLNYHRFSDKRASFFLFPIMNDYVKNIVFHVTKTSLIKTKGVKMTKR